MTKIVLFGGLVALILAFSFVAAAPRCYTNTHNFEIFCPCTDGTKESVRNTADWLDKREDPSSCCYVDPNPKPKPLPELVPVPEETELETENEEPLGDEEALQEEYVEVPPLLLLYLEIVDALLVEGDQ